MDNNRQVGDSAIMKSLQSRRARAIVVAVAAGSLALTGCSENKGGSWQGRQEGPGQRPPQPVEGGRLRRRRRLDRPGRGGPRRQERRHHQGLPARRPHAPGPGPDLRLRRGPGRQPAPPRSDQLQGGRQGQHHGRRRPRHRRGQVLGRRQDLDVHAEGRHQGPGRQRRSRPPTSVTPSSVCTRRSSSTARPTSRPGCTRARTTASAAGRPVQGQAPAGHRPGHPGRQDRRLPLREGAAGPAVRAGHGRVLASCPRRPTRRRSTTRRPSSTGPYKIAELQARQVA